MRVALAVGLLVLGYGILYDGLQQIANCPETFWGVMNPLTIYAPCTGSAAGGGGSTSGSTSTVLGVAQIGNAQLGDLNPFSAGFW